MRRKCKFAMHETLNDGRFIYRCKLCKRLTPHPITSLPQHTVRNCTAFSLGAFTADCLAAIGITEWRYKRWKARVLGIPIEKVKCGCRRRETAIDAIGDRAIDFVRWLFRRYNP